MRYLHSTDYNVTIQPGQLEYQLTQNNIQTLLKSEQFAQSEVYAMLIERYDLDKEFTNSASWSYGITYSASSRIILDYATYSSSLTYSIGECVIIPNITNYNNSNYNLLGECYVLTGTSSYGPTTSLPNSTNLWTDIGSQYSWFNVAYPVPLFDYLNYYKVGQQVFWNNQIWTCVTQTPFPSETYAEQFVSINAVPRNIIPTDIANSNYTWWTPGPQYYTPIVGMTYSLGTSSATASYTIFDTLPTNTKFWTPTDNRSQLMVLHYIDIVLYYLHKNIQPTNVPEHRMKAYTSAIKYFDDLVFGKKNSPILVKQPEQGLTIRFGGNVRQARRW